MTTLTPEKEAEERLRSGLDAWAVIFPGAADERIADITTILTSLSTERQAREAAEKEVERLTTSGDATEARYARLLSNAEAQLAALEEAVKPFAAMAGKPLKITAIDGGSLFVSVDTNDFERAAQALSALPPPVPAEEGEPSIAAKLAAYEDAHATAVELGYPSITEALEAAPTQAQDVAGLVEGDLEWLTEILDGHRVPYRDVLTGDGGLYCIGKAFEKDRVAARIDRILSALRPSPISHETKGLVLAAADNNPEMVEVVDFKALANRFLGWPVPASVQSDRCMTMTHAEYPHGRSGTSMMGPDEAENMLRYVLSAAQAAT